MGRVVVEVVEAVWRRWKLGMDSAVVMYVVVPEGRDRRDRG